MEILIGLLIIAVGSFGQSSSYVPIRKVRDWSWESFWLVQGIFAWIVFPWLGASLALPEGVTLGALWAAGGAWQSVFYGVLWGVGGLTFGLSMRYLGVALGQSIALGTCAAFGTLFPALLAGQNLFRGEGLALLLGVCITLAGIAVIGYAGSLRSRLLSDEERRAAVKDFALTKGLLVALLAGFFILEPLGIPVSAIAATGAAVLLTVAKKGRVIHTGNVLRGAPWQIVIFSLGMYLVVYGLRNAGLTDALSGVLNVLAENGLWVATLGTGVLTAVLSSLMNNMPTVLVGALSIDGSTATGVIKEAMIYANVIGCDLGPKITPIGSLATLLWLHVLVQKNRAISWGYYFRTGIIMTLPVLLVTLAALALRLSFSLS